MERQNEVRKVGKARLLLGGAAVLGVLFAGYSLLGGKPPAGTYDEVRARIAEARGRLEARDAEPPAEIKLPTGNAECPRCGKDFVVNPKLRGQIRCPSCRIFLGAQEAIRTAENRSLYAPARPPSIPSPEEEYAVERKRIEDKKRLDERRRLVEEMRQADMKRDEIESKAAARPH